MAPTKTFGFAEREEFRKHVEQRMEAHHRLQHAVEYALIEEIIEDVLNLPSRRPKTARLFEVDAQNAFGLEPRQ